MIWESDKPLSILFKNGLNIPLNIFLKVERKPRLFIPLLIVALGYILYIYLTVDIIVNETITQAIISGHRAPSTAQLKPIMITVRFFKAAFSVLAISTIIWFLVNLTKYGIDFKRILIAVLYGEIAYICGVICIKTPMMLLGKTADSAPSLVFLGEYLMLDKNNLLRYLLSRVDLIIIGEIIVIGIGLSIICHCSKNKALAISFLSVWLIPTLFQITILGRAY